MLAKARSLIESKQYAEAERILLNLVKAGDEENQSKAAFFLGLLYAKYYPSSDEAFSIPGDKAKARKYLLKNISSNYPQPYAYYLFAQVEDDENIVLNYLKQGAKIFPSNIRILRELFFYSPDKETVISQIETQDIEDFDLRNSILGHYIDTFQWDKAKPYISYALASPQSSHEIKILCTLLNGYANLFQNEPNYSIARDFFENAIEQDVNNTLAYSQYIGLVYSLLKLGECTLAVSYFDRIPVNNSVYDYPYGNHPPYIYFEYTEIYKIIFKEFSLFFANDKERKLKSNTIYALYLYFPTLDYSCEDRYTKSDVSWVAKYLKKTYRPEIAAALYNMRCHFRQYKDAYEAFWLLIENGDDPEQFGADFSALLDEIPDGDISELSNAIADHLTQDDYSFHLFRTLIFKPLVEKLHSDKNYSAVAQIADKLDDTEITESNCEFECAFSFRNQNNPRALAIYEAYLKTHPKNSAVLNNIGVIYEENGDIDKAQYYFSRAHSISPDDEILSRNLNRVNKKIQEKIEQELTDIRKKMKLEGLEEIGYTVSLIERVSLISGEDMRKIIQRDIWECAIAIISGQDISATVLCGSVMEALLLSAIQTKGIEKYDISEISKGKRATSYPVKEMGLNELLLVAKKEDIIQKNTYHLGHYIRDYRNVVHPAKEVRMSESITHEEVITMWNVLKRVVDDLAVNVKMGI